LRALKNGCRIQLCFLKIHFAFPYFLHDSAEALLSKHCQKFCSVVFAENFIWSSKPVAFSCLHESIESFLSYFSILGNVAFDFFSAMYFLKARRLFCLLRLREFFRASSFMVNLLVCWNETGGLLTDESFRTAKV
jgi:hypothetical protein